MVKLRKRAPKGALVVQAFSKYEALCGGLLEQQRELPAGSWVDLGIDWDAIDRRTVLATWPFLDIQITLDGVEIPDPTSYARAPRYISILCPDQLYEGWEIALRIFLPPGTLPPGDHVVIWKTTPKQDVDDGWSIYPKGVSLYAKSRLLVKG
jgi:hypothetical protein